MLVMVRKLKISNMKKCNFICAKIGANFGSYLFCIVSKKDGFMQYAFLGFLLLFVGVFDVHASEDMAVRAVQAFTQGGKGSCRSLFIAGPVHARNCSLFDYTSSKKKPTTVATLFKAFIAAKADSSFFEKTVHHDAWLSWKFDFVAFDPGFIQEKSTFVKYLDGVECFYNKKEDRFVVTVRQAHDFVGGLHSNLCFGSFTEE